MTTTFSALSDRKLVYTRNFAFGGQQLTDEVMARYGLNPAEAERAKQAGDLPEDYATDLLAGFRDDMARQVSRSLQFFLASQDGAGQPVQVLVEWRLLRNFRVLPRLLRSGSELLPRSSIRSATSVSAGKPARRVCAAAIPR